MLLTNAYDPDPRVRQEALALMRLGYRVRLLAWDRDRKARRSERVEGVEVERVFLSSTHGRGSAQILFYAWLYVLMFWRGWRTRFDVVHCHDLDTLPLGFVLAKLKRKRVVYDAHESFPDMLEGSVPRFVQRSLTLLENVLIRRVDLLITVGEKLRRHFAGRGARRTAVVGNWKRLDEYARSDAANRAFRAQLGIPQSALVVVCITQLLKDRKLEAFLEAVDGCPDIYAVIGGDGLLRSLVEQYAARNARIVYAGFVPGREIPAYTCAADAVYYGFDPSNPNARFSAPNKLFEALAAGRTVITGDFGEIADVVRAAGCGIVLPEYSAAAIARAFAVLADPAERTRLAGNAFEYGRKVANWAHAESTLAAEYGRLSPIRTAGAHGNHLAAAIQGVPAE